jgi:hypothetical protein
MENNYFEGIGAPQASEDEIVKRIKECEMVVERLGTDSVWQIVIKDSMKWVRELDGKWQDVGDEKMLGEMRILKIAYKHILDLPRKYKEDLKALQEALDKNGEIKKDYDE